MTQRFCEYYDERFCEYYDERFGVFYFGASGVATSATFILVATFLKFG